MSSLEHPLVTWSDYLLLPERPETGKRYELHDGEAVLAPPARPLHVKLQKRIERLLEALAGESGVVTTEFPYRPVINLRYWFADVAFILQADWDALPPDDYPVYAPALIVEVLSPSNTSAKISRQRIAALPAGTQEFWVVDPERRTVLVTNLSGTNVYTFGDDIPLPMFGATVFEK
jgi:Uma2 family endonuclease